ncbi:MAG: hypothetical protein RLY14_505, partial [Planctomycetota bacterium]
GLIVGSALVRRISESAAAGEQAVLTGVDDLVSGLLKTLREVS